METLKILNISIQIWGIFLGMIALWGIHTILGIKEKNMRKIMALILVDALLLLFDVSAWLCEGRPSNLAGIMAGVSCFISSLCNSLMMVLISGYICQRMESPLDVFTRLLKHAIFVLVGMEVFLLILSQKIPLIYVIDANHYFSRGPLFLMEKAIEGLECLFIILILVRNPKQFNRKEYGLYLGGIGVLTGTLVAEALFDAISFFNIALTLLVLFLVVYNMIERMQNKNRQILILQQQQLEAQRQAHELEQATQKIREHKTELLVSQIQPHFIFNSLLVIRSLCQEDVEKAIEAINYFSKYLRICLDSLNNEKLIPLERELELSECYLYMEKLRFESAVTFHKEIENNSFRLPALTIQPILENAVKHGLRKLKRPGSIWLKVKDEEREHVIRIRDNGVGFDPGEKKQDGRNHVGIQNVTQRLKYLCGGTLQIVSHPGEGTEVIIRIPKEETEDELSDCGR